MASKSADPSDLADIRRLASDPTKVQISTTAKYDLMGAKLTVADICDEIMTWIDGGQRVKKVILRGRHAGQAAFEMKPRISGTRYYIKIALCEVGDADECLLIVSAHVDH